jgi:hypothetical protein
MHNKKEDEAFRDLIIGIIFALLSMIIIIDQSLQIIVKPKLYDGSLIAMGRYAMTNDALDTIEEDDSPSIIAMGSSMMFKAFNGSCFDENDGVDDANYYNLAIPSSRPYNDMVHIPRIIQSKPEIVMLEVGVNLMVNPGESSMEYLEFRYKLDTMLQNNEDVGEWISLLENDFGDWIATNDFERMEFMQDWFPDASEEILSRAILNESGVYPFSTYPQVPTVGSSEWLHFLQEPEWPPIRFDAMSPEVSQQYNETEMPNSAAFYHPESNGTLSHLALEYMVEELVNADIQVVLTALPHHPLVYQYLQPGQWDPLNESLSPYVGMENVHIIDNTWAEGWNHDHFDDRNHLDGDGRDEFCRRIAPSLLSILLDAGQKGNTESSLEDRDRDGFFDIIDAFPDDNTEHHDIDGDGYGDNADIYPHDPNENTDSDGDGHGDNSDLWPNDIAYWADLDQDGVPDQIDYCNSPIIQSDQVGFSDYDVDNRGCYDVISEEGVYILQGGICTSSICMLDGGSISPIIDYVILTVEYTSSIQMWVDYNQNQMAESWEVNFDDMYAWYKFDFYIDTQWYEENAMNFQNLPSNITREYFFNFIDNSSGQKLAHLVEMTPCDDIIDDSYFGPINPLTNTVYINLEQGLNQSDPFLLIENQTDSWMKIGVVGPSNPHVCSIEGD